MTTVTLSSKNQIVVPKEVRKALDLKAGDKLTLESIDGQIVIKKQPSLYDLVGTLPKVDDDPVGRIHRLWEDAED